MDGVRIKWLGSPITIDSTKDESLAVPEAQADEVAEGTPVGMNQFLAGKGHAG